MKISFFWSRSFLLSRWMLWLLLWVNGLGTIYGFEWYSKQIVYTLQEKAIWFVLFVPDSPTASLFFTAAIAYLLRDQYIGNDKGNKSKPVRIVIRRLVEAMAVITSIKYGIWAVAMIIAGTMQGDLFEWQHGMLIVSHLGMAVEAIIFARFFAFRKIHIFMIAIWTLCNDLIDYHYGVYPWLSQRLQQFLPVIKWFTILLSCISISFAFLTLKLRKKF